MSLDLTDLLQPIAGTDRVGGDLRAIGGHDSLYFKLKDARAQARTIERASEAAGEPANVPAEWQNVRDLSIEALRRSKDIEVAVWLLEALVRLNGFAGLSAGFALLQGLIESYWPLLHSIDEDDAAGRLSPLTGLNGTGADGALVQPIRMVSLLPDCAFGTYAFWHFSRVQKDPGGSSAHDFNDMRASVDQVSIRNRALQALAARDAYSRLIATVDALAGVDAPPSSNIRNALEEVVEAYRSILGVAMDGADIDGQQTKNATRAASAGASAQPPTDARELSNREDAFAELLRVADFFRRKEPHSPISYALETLVSRGRMSFVDLLEELVPDVSARRQMLQHAGIQAQADGKAR